MARVIKTTSAGGEIAPDLFGRVDYQKYPTGVAFLENFFVERYGGISNRGGLRYSALLPTEEGTGQAVLIPFKFSDDQSYMLEFTENVMRVYRDGNLIIRDVVVSGTYKWTASGAGTSEYYLELDAGGDPSIPGVVELYENSTLMTRGSVGSLTAGTFDYGDNDTLGYTTIYVRLSDSTDPDSKADGYLESDYQLYTGITYAQMRATRYTQSFDTMWLTNYDFAPKTLTRTAEDNWTIQTYSFVPGINPPFGLANSTDGTLGGSTRDVYYKVAAVSSENEESLTTDQLTVNTGYPWQGDFQVNLFWNSIRDSSDFKWTASGSGTDEYYMDLSGGGDPSIAEPVAVYENKAAMTEGTLGSLAAGEWGYGDNDTLGFNTVYVRLSGAAADPDDASYHDGYLTLKRTEDETYNVYKDIRGFFGWIGGVSVPWYVDDNIDPDINSGFSTRDNPFDSADNYPRACGLFQQRLVLGGTENKPSTTWMSRSGRFNDFGKREPLTDDDRVEAQVDSGVLEDVRYYAVGKDLVMFTGSGTWIVNHGDNSDAITPTNISFDPQEYDGISSTVPPIRIGQDLIFVQSDNKRIRSLNRDIQVGGYNSQDLAILVPHLFEGKTVQSWAYQRYPNYVVWMTLSDGSGLGLTYLKEQDIYAFFRFTSPNGELEAVGVAEGDEDDTTYVVVRRLIDGSYVRYMEVLDNRTHTRVEESFFLDSGLTYDEPLTVEDISVASEAVVTITGHGLANGDWVQFRDLVGMDTLDDNWYVVSDSAANTFKIKDPNTSAYIDTSSETSFSSGEARKGVTTISNLDHLEGQTIGVLADGMVVSDPLNHPTTALTVSSGSVTLPRRFATVHAGLAYESNVQTLALGDFGGSSIQGHAKTIKNVIYRLKESRVDLAGPDEDNLTPILQRQYEGWGKPTQWTTGDIKHPQTLKWDKQGQVYYRQSIPLPVTIEAFIMEFTTDIG